MFQKDNKLHKEVGEVEREDTGEKIYLGPLNKSQKHENKEAKDFDKEQDVDQFSKCRLHGEVRTK